MSLNQKKSYLKAKINKIVKEIKNMDSEFANRDWKKKIGKKMDKVEDYIYKVESEGFFTREQVYELTVIFESHPIGEMLDKKTQERINCMDNMGAYHTEKAMKADLESKGIKYISPLERHAQANNYRLEMI